MIKINNMIMTNYDEIKRANEAYLLPRMVEYRTHIQTCAILNITKQTLNNWVKKGWIEPKRIGGRRFYHLGEIKRAVRDKNEPAKRVEMPF